MVFPVLAVEDIQTSLKFYTEELAFDTAFVLPGPDGSPIYANVTHGSGVNILLSLQPGVADKGRGVVFMLYMPEGKQIDAYYEEVQGRGVTIETPIADQYWGDRTFAVLDPDGFHLIFAQTNRQVPMEEIESVTGSRDA